MKNSSLLLQTHYCVIIRTDNWIHKPIMQVFVKKSIKNQTIEFLSPIQTLNPFYYHACRPIVKTSLHQIFVFLYFEVKLGNFIFLAQFPKLNSLLNLQDLRRNLIRPTCKILLRYLPAFLPRSYKILQSSYKISKLLSRGFLGKSLRCQPEWLEELRWGFS